MKMRRIRVRSLLAGCISCLRSVWTSGLTCRSSPFASPRTAVLSARLSFRSAGRRILFIIILIILTIIILWSLSSPVAERNKSVSRNRLCAYSFHIGSLSSVPLPFGRGRTYLSLRRTVMNIGLKARKHFGIHGYKPSLWYCQKFTSPPQAAV